jgi:hypothetical protein
MVVTASRTPDALQENRPLHLHHGQRGHLDCRRDLLVVQAVEAMAALCANHQESACDQTGWMRAYRSGRGKGAHLGASFRARDS